VRHSPAIKVLTVFLAAFLLFATAVQERHVHPGPVASADCSICLAAHSPATVTTPAPLPVLVMAIFVFEAVLAPFLSFDGVKEHFIRPPPAVL